MSNTNKLIIPARYRIYAIDYTGARLIDTSSNKLTLAELSNYNMPTVLQLDSIKNWKLNLLHNRGLVTDSLAGYCECLADRLIECAIPVRKSKTALITCELTGLHWSAPDYYTHADITTPNHFDYVKPY